MAAVTVFLLGLIWRRDWEGRRASVLFLALFGGIALVTGIGQRTGEGVYYDAHLETLLCR